MRKNEIEQSKIVLDHPQPNQKNPAVTYLASLPSRGSQETQRLSLQIVARVLGTTPEYVNWKMLRNEHTSFIQARLVEHYSPASVRKIMSALCQTLKKAWLMGQMNVDDYGKAIVLNKVEGETLPSGRGLTQGEISALMNACQKNKNKVAGIRDAAIIGLLYSCGLRRAEIVSITLDALDTNNWKAPEATGNLR